MAMLLLLSSKSTSQWNCWQAVRALATHVVVSAEAAQAVAQHGRGLVRLPHDMLQTLDGYFKEAGLTGKRAKLRSRALTEQLKALSRSQARGGLQHHSSSSSSSSSSAGSMGLAGWQQQQQGGMTAEQLQEQAEMEAEMEQMAATFGPEALARHRQARAAAAASAALVLPTTKGGRLTAKAQASLLAHIEAHGMMALPHEHVRAALGLPPSSSLDSPERSLALAKVTPSYSEGQALAYALARLPGCYAACARIFGELAVRLPGFAPRSLLDFGAGPGTASWAAQEVWAGSLARLTAVEPAPAMRRLGERLEAARRFAHPTAPLVRWRSELPPPLRGARASRGSSSSSSSSSSRADVVVASYVLGELPDLQQRAALVRHLWSLTSELLVLVEPGTPAGHAHILAARDALLQHEQRRHTKLQRRQPAAAAAAAAGSMESPLTGEQQQQQQADPNLSNKLGSKWFGAHVVAPCPHDGRCPLSGPGAKAWCHFGTRFQRPGFMQAVKALPGTHVNPADHQDERYSYVVLRRGARPAAAVQVGISRSFAPSSSSHSRLGVAAAAADDAFDDDTAGGEEQLQHGSSSEDEELQEAAHHMQQQQQQQGSILEASPERLSSSGSSLIQPGVQDPADAAYPPQQQQQQQQQQQASAAADAKPGAGLFTSTEMQQLSALLGGPAPPPQQQQPDTATAAAARGEHFRRVDAKLDVFGTGLVARLAALEEAGVDWASGHGDGLSRELAAAAAGVQPGAGAAAAGISSSSSASPITADNISSSSSSSSSGSSSSSPTRKKLLAADADAATAAVDSGDESGSDDEAWDMLNNLRQQPQQQQQQQVGVQQQQEELGYAAAASVAWSRVIRPPRKRGGHVILDVCAAASPADSAAADSTASAAAAAAAAGRDADGSWPQPPGRLERHVLAKSDARGWLGGAAYRMARDAQWGDLWCWASSGTPAPK